ncbi:protein kinase [Embleya sp. NPDC020886]|uniref:protein kinase domain-containing protein n=1 Tax=Embleya sp. NPDC020886 TaxID=3363980 RepID=UPI00379990AE
MGQGLPVVGVETVGNGRYRLLARIGAGGMGIVWRAWDELLRRPVAIKCARVNDPQSVRRLRDEAAIAASFDSPYIVTVFDLVVEHDTWWLVMEYVESRSLGQCMARPGQRPTPAWVASIGWQIAEALREVHAHSVVHGDVTPENILVTADGTGKLADFGISRALGAAGTGPRDRALHGKPGYLAPEVARGREVGRASDMFSLGASLFAVLEGQGPYGSADDPRTQWRRAREGRIDKPVASGELTELLQELLRVRPGRRPGPADVAARLRALTSPDDTTTPWPRTGIVAGPVTGFGTPMPAADTTSGVRPPFRFLPIPRRRPQSSKRPWPLVVGATTLATVGVLTWSPLIDPKPAPTPAAARTILVGDERTVDPCALLDPASLTRFGRTVLDSALGGFRRCDLLVHGAEDRRVADAELSFTEGGQELGPQLRTRRIGDITLIEGADDARECPRILRLPDGYVVKVTISNLASEPVDLCGMADAVTTHAIDVLGRGPIPRRPSAPRDASLIRLDACALLDPAALARMPTIDAQHPNAGFGDWKCRWHSTVDKTAIILRFYQREPLPADIGRPEMIADRRAFVTPGEADRDLCTIRVVHRTYPNAAHPIVELVQIEVYAAQPREQLCATADRLGAAVVAKLPRA